MPNVNQPQYTDPGAILDEQRLFSQHQIAITLLEKILSNPGIKQSSWADLGCGPGQMMMLLEKRTSAFGRAKIDFWPFDKNPTYLNMIMTESNRLGFKYKTAIEGDLIKFDDNIPATQLFDFITLINTIHEVNALYVGDIFYNCIKRLSPYGQLYIYDMERLIPPEPLAVPWTKDNIQDIVDCILNTLGELQYRPTVQQWNHSTRNGWSLLIDRQFFSISQGSILTNKNAAIEAVRSKVIQILEWRLKKCKLELESSKNPERYDVLKPEDEGSLTLEIRSLEHTLEFAISPI